MKRRKFLSLVLATAMLLGVFFISPTVAATNSFANAQAISLEQGINVNITTSYQKLYYSFTPTTTGVYTIESFNNGTSDPFVWLYSPDQAELFKCDNRSINPNDPLDPNGFKNFRIFYHLTANTKYYIAVGCAGATTGSYWFNVVETERFDGRGIFSMPFTTLPTQMAPASAPIDVAYKKQSHWCIAGAS